MMGPDSPSHRSPFSSIGSISVTLNPGNAIKNGVRVAIEKLDGRLVAERSHPRESFAGHELATPWNPLQRAYFNGYALWTYLTGPA